MPATTSDRSLHGGVARVLALAARVLRYAHGSVSLLDESGDLRTVVREGDHDELLLAAARAVCGGRSPGHPEVLAAALEEDGAVVGAICLSGPAADADQALAAEALRGFAGVLSDQLELLRRLGTPPDPDAVDRLRTALRDGEVVAWFQPVVDLVGGRLVGFEALARWRDARGEVAGPGHFVPLAEQAGLVSALDEAVLRDAVAHLASWQQERPDLRLSVNVSGRHLDDEGWLDAAHALVIGAGVDPATVDLELTESARPADVLRSVQVLQRARSLGYAIWLDDFGTGWSELRHLVELPVDGVKIDRFFTEALGGRGDAMVSAMVGLARELGLATIVEGVSEPSHAERARELGCRLAQGFLWSRAVPPAEVPALLSRAAC